MNCYNKDINNNKKSMSLKQNDVYLENQIEQLEEQNKNPKDYVHKFGWKYFSKKDQERKMVNDITENFWTDLFSSFGLDVK